MYRSRVRTSLAAVAAAAVLATAGCGVQEADDGALGVAGPGNNGTLSQGNGTTEGPGPFEGTGGVVYLQQAADATASMDTMSMTMDLEMTGMPLIGNVSMAVEGSIDNEAELAYMKMDMSEMYDAMGSLGSEDLPADAGIMEMIIDGDTTYVKSSLFDMMPGAESGKPWHVAPSDEVSDSETFGQGSNDPREFLEFLRNSGSEVTDVGTEEIRGVQTTHLQTVLTPENLYDSASEDEQADMESSLEDLGAQGIDEIPVDVWVDADGMVRKMVMTMDLSEATTDDGLSMEGVGMTMSYEMFDFGEPVDITVPDESETQELDTALLED